MTEQDGKRGAQSRGRRHTSQALVTVTPFAIALVAYVLAWFGLMSYNVAIATIALMAVFKR